MAKNKGNKVPKVYTSILTLKKAYSILKDVGIEWLMAGKVDKDIDFQLLHKQFSGKGSFDDEKVKKELYKVNEFILEIAEKLLGDEDNLIKFYETITKTDIDDSNDPEVEIVLEAIVNFFFAFVKKVPKFTKAVMTAKGTMK